MQFNNLTYKSPYSINCFSLISFNYKFLKTLYYHFLLEFRPNISFFKYYLYSFYINKILVHKKLEIKLNSYLKSFFNNYLILKAHTSLNSIIKTSNESKFKKIKNYRFDVNYKLFFLRSNNKFKNFLHIFMKKFMSSGKLYNVEKRFNYLFNLNKNIIFYFYLYEAIEILRPSLDIQLYMLKSKGKKRSVKKGKKAAKQLKVIPVEISDLKSYKIAFKWLVKSIYANPSKTLSIAIIKELSNLYLKKEGKALEYKESMYKAASVNRSLKHYRWKRKWLRK